MKSERIAVPNLITELTEVRPSEISGLGLFAKQGFPGTPSGGVRVRVMYC